MVVFGEIASFAHQPPTIEIRDRIAVVRYGTSERAMPVRVFAKAIERGQKALRLNAAGEENVLVDD